MEILRISEVRPLQSFCFQINNFRLAREKLPRLLLTILSFSLRSVRPRISRVLTLSTSATSHLHLHSCDQHKMEMERLELRKPPLVQHWDSIELREMCGFLCLSSLTYINSLTHALSRICLFHIYSMTRHEKSCKMSANQNSGIQMSTHILANKYTISKNLIPIYDLKGLFSTHKAFNLM